MPRFARNLAAVLVWEIAWGFGNACTASAIFVPFLSQLAGSKRIVGNVGLTMLLGVPALVISLWLDHRLRRRRVAVALLWAAQFVSWIPIGAMLLGGSPSPALVPVIYVSQSVFAFLAGVAMAPTYQLLTSVFGDRFATAQGLQLLFRQVSGVLGGLWVATVLARHPYPTNFGVAFLVGGIVLTASNAAVLLFVEGESVAPEDEPFWPALRRALASARRVASLFWIIACVATASSVQTFLVVSALERLDLGTGHAGVFESVSLAASGIGGAIAGRAGDKIGHARALVVAFALEVVAFGLAVKLYALSQVWVLLVVAGAAQAALLIGLAGITAKLAPLDARGGFMAIMRWITQIVSAIATAAAAYVADRAGYAVLFGASALMVLVTGLALRPLRAMESRT